MADAETCTLNAPHRATEKALEAFSHVDNKMKAELIKLRHHWDLHEPKMYRKAEGISDNDLTDWDLRRDLVLIRSGPTSYGTVLLGKIALPAIPGGFIHVRVHDPPARGSQDVVLHSILTDEVRDKGTGKIVEWNGILDEERELDFFSE